MDEKISIIIPVYNAEKTLCRCVESIIRQTYYNIEIILVDDGSIDRSVALCNEYAEKDCRVKVVSKTNGGVSSARNLGLDIASGEFIMFCDSDDWVDPEWCETLLLKYQPDNFTMCGQYIEGVQKYFPHKVCSDSIVDCRDFLQLKMNMFNVPWNKIFEKSVIERNHIRYDTKLTNGEDLLFNISYMTYISGKIICINRCLYHYTWPNFSSLSKYIPINYIVQRNYFMGQMERAISRLGDIGNENWLLFYKDLFNEYLKILFAAFSDKSKSLLQRLKTGNEIMRSKEYKKCIRKVFGLSSNKHIWIYKAQNCYGLFLSYKIRSVWKGLRNE